MTFNPHPIVMTAVAGQRRAEILAQAERDRLAKRAAVAGGVRHLAPWPDLVAVLAIVLGLALTLTRTAAAREVTPPAEHGLVPAAVSMLAEDDTAVSAVQTVREAAS